LTHEAESPIICSQEITSLLPDLQIAENRHESHMPLRVNLICPVWKGIKSIQDFEGEMHGNSDAVIEKPRLDLQECRMEYSGV
jgi:hypothetical protein